MTRRQPGLAEGLLSPPEDPTLALDTTREPQQAQPGPEPVTVYVVNGTRTSAGPGPGPLRLPPAEAGALVAARLAVYGDRPPNVPDPAPAARPFGAPVPPVRAAQSN